MSQTVLVLGLGTTGQAALHYCIHHDIPVAGYDDVVKENLRDVFHVPLYFKILPESVLKTLQSVILSPGISDQHPLVLQLQQHHIPIKSDIDYFAKRCPGTIIGITGANGKSTVTALVTHLLTCLGFRAVACGNFGYPVLQLLDQDPFDYYVVELSSYQLEWTSHLNAKVGCLLNITPNHLDRYHTIQAYQQAKERLFAQCDRVIMHTSVQPITMPTQEVIYFSEDPQKKDTALFHARMDDTGCMSFYQGSTCLWTFTHQKRLGTHHYANQLAALAILHGLSFSAAEACKHLHTFRGLPHRIEHIQSSDECVWINDSKSTTTTATIAALETMVQEYPEQSIILIMGGVFKEYDLSLLIAALQHVPLRHIIVYGRDQEIFIRAFHPLFPLQPVATLNEAVSFSRSISAPQDIILLSPACASLDQFRNFEARGEAFKALVVDIK